MFGLEAILRRIQSHVPETRVLSLEDFSVEEIEVMGGDLAKMLGMQEDYRETVPSAKLRAPARATPQRAMKHDAPMKPDALAASCT